MVARLAVLTVGTGIGIGAVLALPAFALAVAPWVGVALLIFAGGWTVWKLATVRADLHYRCFHAALQADTERFRLRLEAGRGGTGRDVDVWQYYQER